MRTDLEANPAINWAKWAEAENGDSKEEYGVVRIRVGNEVLGVDARGQFTRWIVNTSSPINETDSTLSLGYPGRVALIVYSDLGRIFSTQDHIRINDVARLTETLVTALHQHLTAIDVRGQADKLIQNLSPLIRVNDAKVIEGAGILEELIEDLRVRELPSRIIDLSEQLVDLGVQSIRDRYGLSTIHPRYLIEYLSSDVITA